MIDAIIYDYSSFRDIYDTIDKSDKKLKYKIELSELVLKSKISERDLKEIIGFLLRT
jgi:hypothetical protein